MAAPVFSALTRPVSVLGLPLTYVVLLWLMVVGGFVASSSFIWLGASAMVGYSALRLLASHDPRLLDVVLLALRKTPVPRSWWNGQGSIYDA